MKSACAVHDITRHALFQVTPSCAVVTVPTKADSVNFMPLVCVYGGGGNSNLFWLVPLFQLKEKLKF